jgi:hypothetical protein
MKGKVIFITEMVAFGDVEVDVSMKLTIEILEI